MVTVRTKQELKNALENKETKIHCVGEIAKQIRKKKQAKNAAKVGGIALVIGGLIAAPFTGGASLAGTAAGLTVGTLTISTAELAILCGATLGLAGVLNGYNVKFNSDGSVELTR